MKGSKTLIITGIFTLLVVLAICYYALMQFAQEKYSIVLKDSTIINCSKLILATGHSARDIFEKIKKFKDQEFRHSYYEKIVNSFDFSIA